MIGKHRQNGGGRSLSVPGKFMAAFLSWAGSGEDKRKVFYGGGEREVGKCVCRQTRSGRIPGSHLGRIITPPLGQPSLVSGVLDLHLWVNYFWSLSVFFSENTISQTVVRGVVGQAIKLPCTYSVPSRDHLTSMCWGKDKCPNSKCSNEILRTNGMQVTSRKSRRYQLNGQITRGDVSLTILNVNNGDNGAYCCRIEVRGWFNDIKKNMVLQVDIGEYNYPSGHSFSLSRALKHKIRVANHCWVKNNL